MTMNYNDFKKNLHLSSNGNIQDRNKAQGKLLELRSADPDKYQEYFNKARQETKNENSIRC